MSAFQCSAYHISVLAAYVTARNRSSYVYHAGKAVYLTDVQMVGDILHRQNERSVNARYAEHNDTPFLFDPLAHYRMHSPVAILKAAQCYTYQACETDDYLDTLAKRIIDAIMFKAIGALPGYEEADWSLDRPANANRLLRIRGDKAA